MLAPVTEIQQIDNAETVSDGVLLCHSIVTFGKSSVDLDSPKLKLISNKVKILSMTRVDPNQDIQSQQQLGIMMANVDNGSKFMTAIRQACKHHKAKKFFLAAQQFDVILDALKGHEDKHYHAIAAYCKAMLLLKADLGKEALEVMFKYQETVGDFLELKIAMNEVLKKLGGYPAGFDKNDFAAHVPVNWLYADSIIKMFPEAKAENMVNLVKNYDHDTDCSPYAYWNELTWACLRDRKFSILGSNTSSGVSSEVPTPFRSRHSSADIPIDHQLIKEKLKLYKGQSWGPDGACHFFQSAVDASKANKMAGIQNRTTLEQMMPPLHPYIPSFCDQFPGTNKVFDETINRMLAQERLVHDSKAEVKTLTFELTELKEAHAALLAKMKADTKAYNSTLKGKDKRISNLEGQLKKLNEALDQAKADLDAVKGQDDKVLHLEKMNDALRSSHLNLLDKNNHLLEALTNTQQALNLALDDHKERVDKSNMDLVEAVRVCFLPDNHRYGEFLKKFRLIKDGGNLPLEYDKIVYEMMASTDKRKKLKLSTLMTSIFQAAKETYPNKEERELNEAIESVKRSNNNSLNNLTINQILMKVGEFFEEECSICLDPMTSNIMELSCKHQYHRDCIKRHFEIKKDCPKCRRHIVLDEDFPSLASLNLRK